MKNLGATPAHDGPQLRCGSRARSLLSAAALGAALLLAVVPCHAMPGDVLLDNCQKSFDELHPLEGGVCWGYLLGVWHTHGAYQSGGQVPRTVCAEEPVPIADLTRAFLEWAQGSPEKLQQDASACVLAAYRQAFPCANSKN